MTRIAGVDLPRNKKINIALTYIYGIGPKIAGSILNIAGVDINKRTDVITEDEIARALGVDLLLYQTEACLEEAVLRRHDLHQIEHPCMACLNGCYEAGKPK